MTRVTPPQKIISFAENKSDLEKITQFITDGWTIVKLIPYGNYFIGVMEKMQHDHTINDKIELFIYLQEKRSFLLESFLFSRLCEQNLDSPSVIARSYFSSDEAIQKDTNRY